MPDLLAFYTCVSSPEEDQTLTLF